MNAKTNVKAGPARILAMPTMVTTAGNALRNGSFEQGMLHWSGAALRSVSEVALQNGIVDIIKAL
ncbi:MAG: hypothetical protein HYY17_12980 [Planctomycetes bacterium]|nr:hypothetical protein [Planctomycetota bacterium]